MKFRYDRFSRYAIVFIICLLFYPASAFGLDGDPMGSSEMPDHGEVYGDNAEKHVRADIQWSGVIVIEDDMVVQVGQVLEVAPWTQVYVKADTGIYIEGTLKVNGGAGARVSFSVLSGAGIWDGITFTKNANTIFSYIENCDISDAKVGVSYETGKMVLEGAGFIDNDVAIKPYLATGTVKNSRFDANKIGLMVDTGTVELMNCSIDNSVSHDMILNNDSRVELSNVSFNKNKIRIDDINSELIVNHFLKIEVNDPAYPDRFPTEVDIIDFQGARVRSIILEPGSGSSWIKCKSLSYTARPSEPGVLKTNYFTSHLLRIERFNAIRSHMVYLDSNKHVIITWDRFSTDVQVAGKSISIRDQGAFMHDIVNLGWKHTTRPEKVDAYNYLAARFRSVGPFTIEFDNHTHLNEPIDNGSIVDLDLVNVVCTLPGKSGDLDNYIVISAHYDNDHRPGVVGADDDGSGVAALLEIAKIIGHMKFNNTIKFIFFDGEEEGYLGSYDYANMAKNNSHSIITDMNLDMIGYNQDVSYPCIIRTNPESLSIANMVSNLDALYDFGLDVKVVNDESYRRSDYFRFWDAGFKAIDFVEAEVVETWNPYYHSVDDTYDKINFTYLSRMTGLAAASLMSLAEPQNIPPTDPAVLGPKKTHLLRPTITWQPSADPNGDDISYHLEVLDTTGYRIVNEILTKNSYTIDSNLTFGETYELRLGAFDPGGGSSNTITIEMSVINTKPVLAPIPDQNLTQDITWTLQLSATDDDLPADKLEFSVNTTLFEIGRYTGYINWTPTKYDVDTHIISFTVHDGNNGSDTQSVKIRVENVNDPPDIIAHPENIILDEDTTLINALNCNDIFSDADLDELVFRVNNSTHILFAVQVNGSVDITPESNWFGTETLELNARDPAGANTTVTLYITVNPVNDAPVLQHMADIVLNESETMEVVPNASDVDGDALTFNFSSPGENGIWETDYFSAGEYLLNVSVSDGTVTVWQAVNVTVININRLPVKLSELPVLINVKSGQRFKITADFMDPDDDVNGNGIIDGSEKNNLTYIWDLPSGVTQTGPELEYRSGEAGTYELKLTIWDSDDGLRIEYVTIYIENPKHEIHPLFFMVIMVLLFSIPVLIVALFLWHRFQLWRMKKDFDRGLEELSKLDEDPDVELKTTDEMTAMGILTEEDLEEDIISGDENGTIKVDGELPPEQLDSISELEKK